MKVLHWDQIEKEQMSPLLARQVVHSETMTIACVFLSKGCFVPEHSHHNEQISFVEQGSMKFVLAGVEKVLGSKEILVIPPNVPHSAEALEESIVTDMFSPRREDWIRGDDSYLRK
jgi:quercetin dioxygenase-like cupin family protein